MCRRKRDSRTTGSESEHSALLSQGTNRNEMDRRLRRVQTIFKNKDHSAIPRMNSKTNSPTCECRKKTTVSGLHRNSLSRIVLPEQSAITNNMMSTSRVQDRVIRESGSGENNRQSWRRQSW